MFKRYFPVCQRRFSKLSRVFLILRGRFSNREKQFLIYRYHVPRLRSGFPDLARDFPYRGAVCRDWKMIRPGREGISQPWERPFPYFTTVCQYGRMVSRDCGGAFQPWGRSQLVLLRPKTFLKSMANVLLCRPVFGVINKNDKTKQTRKIKL